MQAQRDHQVHPSVPYFPVLLEHFADAGRTVPVKHRMSFERYAVAFKIVDLHTSTEVRVVP